MTELNFENDYLGSRGKSRSKKSREVSTTPPVARTEGEGLAAWGQLEMWTARPGIDAKDKIARLGDFLQVRHQGASTIYFWIATLSLSLSSARFCKDSTMSSLDRVVITTLCDPRDRLPGIGKTVEEEHKDPLFPKLAGGCISPQGNEVILASPNAPSCRSPSSGTGNLFQPISHRHHQLSACLGLFKCVVQAQLCLERAMLCREEMVQTRYRFVCFPCKDRRPFSSHLLFF